MPCRCEGYEEDDERQMVVELHRVTRVACDLRTILRRHRLEHHLCQETRDWISEHDQQDADRIARETASGLREQVKRNALNKLTMDEQRALGL